MEVYVFWPSKNYKIKITNEIYIQFFFAVAAILKQTSKKANSRLKKRHIRFPDSKKLQEIIGWDGGEEYNFASSSTSGDSSDEEDIKPNKAKTSRNEGVDEEKPF